MDKLKELRLKAGKTQNDVASYLGIDRTTYTKYETGNRSPDLVTVRKLAEYFQTSSSYLIGETDNPLPPGAKSSPAEVSESDIMFALLDGDVGEITDDMYEDVKRYAQFIKEKKKKSENGNK